MRMGLLIALLILLFGLAVAQNVEDVNYNVTSNVTDTTPPTIEILSPESKVYSTNQVTLDVKANEEVTWYYILNGEQKEFNPPTKIVAKEGKNELTVKAVDKAGNEATKSVVFYVDTTPPRITIVSPEAKTYSTNKITIDARANEVVNWYYVYKGVKQQFTPPVTLTFDEGENTLTILAVDKAGNEAKKDVTFLVDTTPPTIEILSPESKVYSTNQVTLDVKANEEVTWYYILNGEQKEFNPPTKIVAKEGKNELTVKAVDKAGNEATKSVVFYVDTTPPRITIVSPEAKTYSTSYVELKFVANENISQAYYELDGSGKYVEIPVIGNQGSVVVKKLTNKEHEIKVYAKDLAGNWGVNSVKFKIYAVAPTISNVLIQPKVAMPGDEIKISADVFDSSGVRWVRAYITKDGVDVRTVFMNDRDKDGIYTGVWNTMRFTEGGIYNVTVEATDTEGNVAKHPPVQFEILSDKTPPTISNIVVYPKVVRPGSEVKISAKVTDDFGVRWVRAYITKDGNEIRTIFLNDRDGDGVYTGSWDVGMFVEGGSYNVVIYAEDIWGNSRRINIPVEVLADKEPPKVENVKIEPLSGPPGTKIKISAKVTDDFGVRWVRAYITKDGNEIRTIFLNDRDGDGVYTGSWNTGIFTKAGVYDIVIEAIDTKGNVRIVKGFSVEIIS